MSRVSLVLAGAALAALTSCTTAPPEPSGARADARLQQLLAGKVAGPPVDCLPSFNTSNMTVIDESTIAYRRSPTEVYVTHMNGPCTDLGNPSFALLTRQFATNTCSGDIAQVIDTSTHMSVGSCVFGKFTPYRSVSLPMSPGGRL
jgi:hypothetical protein